MDDQEELGLCGLWRLDPDLRATRVDDGIICSNGPCWSPDDQTFYFADTFREEMWAYGGSVPLQGAVGIVQAAGLRHPRLQPI